MLRQCERAREREREAGADGSDDDADENRTSGSRRGPGGESGQRGRDRAEAVRENFHGGFDRAPSGAEGRFVAFAYDAQGVRGYSCAGHGALLHVGFAPPLDIRRVRSEGAEFRIEAQDDASFKAVDNPSCHFDARNEDGTVQVTRSSASSPRTAV